jgi:cytochrome c553
VADITCAACHTRQLNFTRNGKTTGIRIDGGGTLTAFSDVKAGSFETDLGLSLFETLLNPFKFNRFAANVLGPHAWNLLDRLALWRNLASVSGKVLKAFLGSSSPTHYPVQEGYGRSDALGRIGNTVLGDHISAHNYYAGNGPVRFPYLWNIWKFNWLQYNASISQAMARNVGEAMGVGATLQFLDGHGRPLPESERYNTSVLFDNIYGLETTLEQLKPPQWPEDILGKIDQASAARGQQLFQAYCVSCHGPHIASPALKAFTSPGRTTNDPLWLIEPVDVSVVGTDANTANNFVQHTADLTPAGLTLDEVKPMLQSVYKEQQARQAVMIPALQEEIARCKSVGGDKAALNEMEYELAYAQNNLLTDEAIAQKLNSIDLHKVNVGEGLTMLDMKIREHYYAEHNVSTAQQAVYAGFDTLDMPEVVDAYKARPLEGVWAAPPYLHNGSVPNLYELLSPASERSTRFFVGRREFDPVMVGLATRPVDGTSSGFWLDTTLSGNRNTGHEFSAAYQPDGKSPMGVIGPALSPSQRMDLIEYLKIHRDDPDAQAKPSAPCWAQ